MPNEYRYHDTMLAISPRKSFIGDYISKLYADDLQAVFKLFRFWNREGVTAPRALRHNAFFRLLLQDMQENPEAPIRSLALGSILDRALVNLRTEKGYRSSDLRKHTQLYADVVKYCSTIGQSGLNAD